MGNEKSILQQYHITKFFRRQDWILARIKNCCEIWKHKYTHQMVQVYHLNHVPKKKDMDIFQFRSKHQEIVKINFVVANFDDFLCGVEKKVQLLVQHIPLKLTDIDQFTQAEALTALLSVLKGFRLIQQYYGKVEPRQALIGFNHEGKAKAWVSQYSYKNERDEQDKESYFDSPSNQTRRIRKIFSMIERKTRGIILPFELKQQIYEKNFDYEKIIQMISLYGKQRKISLKKYYQEKKSQFQFQNTPAFVSLTEFKPEKKELIEPKKVQLKKVSSLDHLHKEKSQKMSFICPSQQVHQFYRGSVASNVVRSSSTTIRPRPTITFTKPNLPLQKQRRTKEINLSQNISPTQITLQHENKRKSTIFDAVSVDYFKDNQKRNIIMQKQEQSHPAEENVDEKQKKIQVKKYQTEEWPKIEKKDEIKCEQEEKIIQLFQKPEKVDEKLSKPINESQNYQEMLSMKQIISSEVIQSDQKILNQQKPEKVETKRTEDKQKTDDFLDINYLEKSLQKKFSIPSTPQIDHDDLMNIDKLEQGLIKFQKSQKRMSKQGSQLNQESQFTIKSYQKDSIPSQPVQQKMLTPYHLSAASSLNQQNFNDWYKGSRQINKYSNATTDLYISQKYPKSRATTTYNRHSYLNDYKSKKHFSLLYQQKSLNFADKYGKQKQKERERDIDSKYLHHVKKREENKFTSSYNLESNVNLTFNQEKKEAPRVTYQDLRSLLKTDL